MELVIFRTNKKFETEISITKDGIKNIVDAKTKIKLVHETFFTLFALIVNGLQVIVLGYAVLKSNLSVGAIVTVISLLGKAYEPIAIFNVEYIDYKLNKITVKKYIDFLDTKDDLRLVKSDLTDEEMINACKLACLDDFINNLPEKYDTIVGEGGVTLSGGQRQRLAIARAFIQKTEIILFDEATSALDNDTQNKIQKAIDNLKNEYTILIIAHRFSTIINCDRVYFIEDGKVIDSGNHNELLKKCPSYKHLYESEIKAN